MARWPRSIYRHKQPKRSKECVVCGKRIRSGYKYCWEHRNTRTPTDKNTTKPVFTLSGLIILLIALFSLWAGYFSIFIGLAIFGFIFLMVGTKPSKRR